MEEGYQEQTDDYQGKAESDINKVEQLAERIEQYKAVVLEEMTKHIERHNGWLARIEETGFNDPEFDPILLGPMMIGRVEIYYSFARKEAHAVAGKCRNLQRFYEAVAEQGQANMYERVKLKLENRNLHNSTDAQYLSRRIKGRLLEKAAQWEGDYQRWSGIASSYEQTGNATKDLFKLAEYEYSKDRRAGNYV